VVHSQTAFRFGKFRDGAPSLRRVLEALERIPWSGAQTNATRSLGTFPASSTIQRNLSLCNTRLAAAPQLPPETSKNNREQALHLKSGQGRDHLVFVVQGTLRTDNLGLQKELLVVPRVHL